MVISPIYQNLKIHTKRYITKTKGDLIGRIVPRRRTQFATTSSKTNVEDSTNCTSNLHKALHNQKKEYLIVMLTPRDSKNFTLNLHKAPHNQKKSPAKAELL